MAIIDQPNSTPTQNPGAYYPADYSINTLNFVVGESKFDMRKIMLELSYYEDIYSFCTSGYVTVSDAQGFIQLLQLTGNQFVEIDFSKIKNAPNNIHKTFRVYKVENRKPSGNMNVETYKLYFCSEELVLSEQTKISKSYTGEKISNIVTKILTDKLKVPAKKIAKIEETTGVYDFIIPQFKPFEAISWLSTYARPNLTGAVGSDMLFFETKDGYNYRSLQSMFKQPVYSTYKYQMKNLGDKEQSFQEKMNTILNYEFVKTFDMINEIQSGVFANRLVSLDTMTRTKKVTDFNYSAYKSQAISLNSGAVSNQIENRLGKTQEQSPEASFKVATSNAFQQTAPYIKQAPGAVAKDIAIETYVPNRTAQIALANYVVIKATIPGDSGITAGRTINFNLLSLKPTDNKKDLDKLYSGKYLVTAVRHIIQPTAYQTVIEIARDSSANQYNTIGNSQKIKKAESE